MNRKSKRRQRFETKHWLLRKYEALADSIWMPGQEMMPDPDRLVLYWALRNRRDIILDNYLTDTQPSLGGMQFSRWLRSGDAFYSS